MILLACATDIELQRSCPSDTLQAGLFQAGSRTDLTFLPCVVGVGPVAAALTIGTLLERHDDVTGIVNLGICGSYDTDRLPLGATCVATREIWPEYGTNPDDGRPFSFPMLPTLPLDLPGSLQMDPDDAAVRMGLSLNPDWQRGPSITVAGVSSTPERAADLQTRYRAATENMEGFALALAAASRKLPFLEIRTVSNQAGQRDKSGWNFKAALQSLAAIVPQLTKQA